MEHFLKIKISEKITYLYYHTEYISGLIEINIDICEKITYNSIIRKGLIFMLIRFAVENHLSFKDMTEFNMSAGKITRHSDHVAEKNGKRILKGGFIFGANASGKTNFIRAISFAKKIVTKGLSNVSCDKKYFRIESSCKNRPGIFQFDIFSGNHFYSYGFAMSYTNINIEEEWLYQVDEGDKCIFLRSKSENGEIEFSSDITFSTASQQERFNVYSDDIKNPKMEKTLFLSDVLLRSPDDKEYQPFRDVMEWFQKLIIVFPDSKYGGITQLMEDDSIRKELSLLLEYFDTGIKSVNSIEKNIDKIFANIPKSMMESLKLDIFKELSEQTKGALIQRGDSLIEVNLRDEDLYASEIVTNHGNDNDLFEFEDESDGTKRLFDLIPLYQHVRRGHVIIIDELDRSLHTKATLEFIKYFYKVTLNCPAQLIATTHDSNIMDLDFLRQDEVWFVERQEDHSSHIFSLNKFKTRFDKKIEKDYLLGRYGAIPIFNQLLLDEVEEGDSCAD